MKSFRWSVSDPTRPSFSFAEGGDVRHFKKPGLGKMPKKISYPPPAGASPAAPRRQVALGWAGSCGWCRCRRHVLPLPSPGRDQQCSTVSIWATDNHHANLGLQTLSINLKAKPSRSLSCLFLLPSIWLLPRHHQSRSEFSSFLSKKRLKPRYGKNQTPNHLRYPRKPHLAATLTINANPLMTRAVAPGPSSISN